MRNKTYSANCEIRRICDCYQSLTLLNRVLPIFFVWYNSDSCSVSRKDTSTTQAKKDAALIPLIYKGSMNQSLGVNTRFMIMIEKAR
jgi:hypothetical protein